MALNRKNKFTIGIAAGVLVVIAVVAGVVFSLGSGGKETAQTVEVERVNAETGEVEKKELIEIKTRSRPDCSITPYLIADQLGFLEEEGIKLTFTGTVDASNKLASIVNGDNDLDDAHPNALAMYVKGGAPVTGVVEFSQEPTDPAEANYRHMRYYVRADSPLNTWEDLQDYNNGGEITIYGIAPSCLTFVPTQIFEAHGLDPNRIKFVTFGGDQEALQAMSQGDIDIAVSHPPFYALAESAGYKLLGDSSDTNLAPEDLTGLYYFSDKFIAEHPEAVQGWVNGVTKAHRWLNDPANREEARRLTSEYLNTEAVATHYYATTTIVTESHIQPWIDDLVRGGYLKENEIKPSDILTHQFENKVLG